MTKEEGGRMTRGLNKQSYVFQLSGGEVIAVPQLDEAHKSSPTGNDCCVFAQDSPEPRYLKIFTAAEVVVASVG
jgi:hypothetical protein